MEKMHVWCACERNKAYNIKYTENKERIQNARETESNPILMCHKQIIHLNCRKSQIAYDTSNAPRE